jgi:sugar phosphate isomerase/epimerase
MFYKALAPGCIGHGVRFTDAAGLAAKHGFEGYWFDAGMDFEGDPDKSKELLNRHGLRAAGFGLPVEFRMDDKEYKEDMAKLPALLDFAEKIGVARCATWILPAHNSRSFEENFELHRSRLRPAARMLEDHGMLLGLEFVGPKKSRSHAKHEFIYDLDGMLKLCGAIGTGNCGILMDAWHWHMAGQVFDDFSKFTSPDLIACVHIMDAPLNIPDDEQEDSARRLPGATGVIHIDEFFAGLATVGYEGPVLAEPFEKFLSKIAFGDALKITKASIDRVWPN